MKLAVVAALLSGGLLSACSQTIPLDPLIGDTGQPLSALAQRTDVTYYQLDLEILPAEQAIQGVGLTEFYCATAHLGR